MPFIESLGAKQLGDFFAVFKKIPAKADCGVCSPGLIMLYA